MDQKEKLIEILQLAPRRYMSYDEYADYLLKTALSYCLVRWGMWFTHCMQIEDLGHLSSRLP